MFRRSSLAPILLASLACRPSAGSNSEAPEQPVASSSVSASTYAHSEPTAVPTTPPPPRVAELLAKVDPARIRADIDALAAFGTRHTLSTDAPDRGIKAASRYLLKRFEEAVVGDRAAGPLAVSLDTHQLEPDGRRVTHAVELSNVVAVLPGSMPEAAHRHVYVLGHYDSRASDVMEPDADAPGANDDASGVALTLELARVLAGEPLDATVVFMATAGEEQGLLGARRHAASVRDQGRFITGVLSNDIVGDPTAPNGARYDTEVRVFSTGVSRVYEGEGLAEQRKLGMLSDGDSRQLARFIATVAQWEGTRVQPRLVFRLDRFLRGGDHLAFDELGYPAVRFTEVAENYDRQHQDPRTVEKREFGDFPEHVDADYLADVTRLDGAALIHLANAPARPAGAVVVAKALTTDTTVKWQPGHEPDLVGYEVVWRRTTSPRWQQVRDVGLDTQATIDLHKDDWIFGVRAYDRDGYRSPVSPCGVAL
ncbi:MAG: M20/M25/M40 family metallo-hydrolase [Myxococcota bacterium]